MWQNCSEAQRIVIILGPRTGRKGEGIHHVEKATGGESYAWSSLLSPVQVCIEVTDYLVCETLLWEEEQTGVKLTVFTELK